MGMHINVETNLKVAQMIDVLRSHSGETMSSKSISEVLSQRGIDILPKTISNYLTVILKQGDYPQLSSQPRVGFVWNADEAEFYANKEEKSNDSSAYRKKSTVMLNSEGYSDPTAGAAIKNTEGEDPYARLGEVWSVNGANGMTEWFMILSDWGSVRIGIPLYMGDYRSRIRVKVELDGIVLYGDATNLRSKPRKYFDTYLGNVGDKKAKAILNDALTAVCDPDISPTVVKEVMPANTITVDGTVYTEADIRSKLDTIITLKGHIDAYAKTVDDLDEELAAAETKIKDLEDAKKNKPIVVQVDGEIYNEEDITAIIRAHNTVRVGDKVYSASDIIALEEGNYIATDPEIGFASDMTADMNYLIQQNAEYKIYKQFFDAYCQGMAKGEVE